MTGRLSTKFPLVLLLLLAALTFWLDHAVQPPPQPRDGNLRHDPDYVIEKFSATRMGADGKPLHALNAIRMLHYPDDDTTYLEQPRLVSTEPAKPALRVKADQATLSSNGENIYLTGNVTVSREADAKYGETTITTSFLHVIPDENIAKTDKPVTITGQNTIIKAVGMELNNRTRITRLLSQVRIVHDKVK